MVDDAILEYIIKWILSMIQNWLFLSVKLLHHHLAPNVIILQANILHEYKALTL